MSKTELHRPVSKKDLSYQHNQIIEGRLQCMSLREQKLLLLAFSRVKKDDVNDQVYSIKTKEVFDLLAYKEKGHSEIKKTAGKIFNKGLFIDKEDDGWTYYPWFSMFRYKAGVGEIQFRFDRDMVEMIKNLQKNFTVLQLGEIIDAKCSYSIKIFQLLKQYYPDIKKRIIPLDELRLKLGIEDKYKLMSHFRARVLNAARKDMTENASLTFNYKVQKSGVKVKAIEFEIIDNRSVIVGKLKAEQTRIDKEPMLDYYKVITKLQAYGISHKSACVLLDDVGEDILTSLINDAEQLNKNGVIPVEKIAGTIVNLAKSATYKKNLAIQEAEVAVERANSVVQNRLWLKENEVRLPVKHKIYVTDMYFNLHLYCNDREKECSTSPLVFSDENFISKAEKLFEKHASDSEHRTHVGNVENA